MHYGLDGCYDLVDMSIWDCTVIYLNGHFLVSMVKGLVKSSSEKVLENL